MRSQSHKNAVNRRYANGPRGTITRRKYHRSKAGKAVANRFRQSPLGKATLRRWKLQHLYGITDVDYDGLLVQQGGHCALCSRTPAQERYGVLCVDHDHAKIKGEPGFVRGLLCRRHNDAVHKLGDTIAGVEMALAYMRGKPCLTTS